MNDYFEYFGCYAVCQKGRVQALFDLDGTEDGDSLPGSVKTLAWCGDCGCWMKHRKVTFKCPSCGQVVKDSDIYEAIQEENIKGLEDYEDYDGDPY